MGGVTMAAEENAFIDAHGMLDELRASSRR
jgi:hypothetical protein